MKRTIFLSLFLLVPLNTIAMEPNREINNQPDKFDKYCKIGLKIAAGTAFAGLAYYFYQLQNNPNLAALENEMTKVDPISHSFNPINTLIKVFETMHDAAKKRIPFDLIRGLSEYSAFSSGIISAIAFKSAYDDFKTTNKDQSN